MDWRTGSFWDEGQLFILAGPVCVHIQDVMRGISVMGNLDFASIPALPSVHCSGITPTTLSRQSGRRCLGLRSTGNLGNIIFTSITKLCRNCFRVDYLPESHHQSD